jgi:putative Holliday junction resolvase
MAIDIGDKRTGLAVGDDETGIVSPLEVVESPTSERGGEAWLEAMARAVAAQFGPFAQAELVVGLPFNMDGTEGPRARIVRELALRLGERTKRAIRFQDERLTSVDADWSMAQSGLTHKQKKERRDALAAAAILRDFLAGKDGVERQAEEP